MADYTPAERVDILLILGECHGQYRPAANLYRERYPNRRHPSHNAIRNIFRRAKQGRLSRVRSHHEYNEDDIRVLVVLATVHVDPHIGSRQIQRQTGIPRTTVLRILKKHKFHAYHIKLTQELSANDMLRRLEFCEWARQMLLDNPEFFNFVMFSDEATFKSDGNLNRHNCHYWSDINPRWYTQVDHQHRWSLNTWCGIVNGYLVGPYFFDNNVNGQNFLEFLRDELPGLLEDVDLQTRQRLWIQLDGAGCHWARIVRDYLDNTFNDRWIGRGGPVAWPPRSPDLTLPDFFLWGFLKNVVYETRPSTRENMMGRIREACQNIPREVLMRTVHNFRRRIDLCTQRNGDVFEQFIR